MSLKRNFSKKKFSDETADCIAAFLLIAIAVSAVIFWLNGMPA